MADPEVEMTDIVVVLDDSTGAKLDELVASLKQAGVQIDDVDQDNGVVEGSVQTAKVKSIEKIPNVKYVRGVFNYLSEPAGDGEQPIPE
ncbi:MAG TPA: hypothetical protein VL992_00290 [Tepidisphaeraceae bacterium]|nr:hypothetical protein [Tepidisphaeraceae bacterium]